MRDLNQAEATELLKTLLHLPQSRGSLALVVSKTLLAGRLIARYLTSRFDFYPIDLTGDEEMDPFARSLGLSPRRFLTGLPFLSARQRIRHLVPLNIGRDRISVGALRIVIWVLEQDVPELYTVAPDLGSFVQEVFSWHPEDEEPVLAASELVAPVDVPDPPEHCLSETELQWLRRAIASRRGPVVIPGTGEKARRRALDLAWRISRRGEGPVAWVELDRLDASRAGEWLWEMGPPPLAVVWGGRPGREDLWPAETAVVLGGLSEDQLPDEEDASRLPAPAYAGSGV